ncbi:MAG: hypothetical protein WB297_17850 [Actinomycetota bacterium]
MKKRFAMVVAGGLVAALLAGSAALSLGLLGASTASAGGDRTAPRIRTVERTVTVHKKKKAPAGAVRYVIAAAPSSSSTGSSNESESEFEHEFEGDEGSSGSGSGGYEDD